RPAIFFSPVVALGAAGLGRFHRLAVDDAGAGGGLPAGGGPDLGTQGGVDALPDAAVAPGVEVVGDGLPGGEVVGEHPPGASSPGQVEDGIDDLPQGVGAGPAGAAVAPGEQVFDVVPLEVGQVTRVSLPCCGIHTREDNVDHIFARDYFLDGLLPFWIALLLWGQLWLQAAPRQKSQQDPDQRQGNKCGYTLERRDTALGQFYYRLPLSIILRSGIPHLHGPILTSRYQGLEISR